MNEVKLYNESLRKQNFALLPILPTCKRCGSEAEIKHTCTGGKIIVLNGTCGSGKSTIAEMLATKGYSAIDGDCVIQAVKYKKSIKKVDFSDMMDEIACEIDILSFFNNNIVLSHIIIPEDLNGYINMFEERNMEYRFILLKPNYQAAVKRCMSRTCHASITPEYWIRHFYDRLVFDENVEIIDNTNMTPEETILTINC